MRIYLPVSLLSLLLICLCASTTKADPILLTSGAAGISFSPGFRFVSITGSGQDLQFHAIDNFDCPPLSGCGPNNMGSISKNNLGGFVIYQGITYRNFSMVFSFLEPGHRLARIASDAFRLGQCAALRALPVIPSSHL